VKPTVVASEQVVAGEQAVAAEWVMAGERVVSSYISTKLERRLGRKS